MKESAWRIFEREELKAKYRASREDYKGCLDASHGAMAMINNSKLCLLVNNHSSGPAGMSTGSKNNIAQNVLAGVGGTLYTGISKEGQKIAENIYKEMGQPEYDKLIQTLDAKLLDVIS
ncbi:hypothetical protein GOV06_04830 [Candidatus Woesearchaeota archaeon]|nr:hypothetical protein [Candidatus Woesearchaeota archaeon]